VTRTFAFGELYPPQWSGKTSDIAFKSFGLSLAIYDTSTKQWNAGCQVGGLVHEKGERNQHKVGISVMFTAEVPDAVLDDTRIEANKLTTEVFNTNAKTVQDSDPNLQSVDPNDVPVATSMAVDKPPGPEDDYWCMTESDACTELNATTVVASGGTGNGTWKKCTPDPCTCQNSWYLPQFNQTYFDCAQTPNGPPPSKENNAKPPDPYQPWVSISLYSLHPADSLYSPIFSPSPSPPSALSPTAANALLRTVTLWIQRTVQMRGNGETVSSTRTGGIGPRGTQTLVR